MVTRSSALRFMDAKKRKPRKEIRMKTAKSAVITRDPIEVVLDRLELVKRGEKGWRGKCPVHQSESSVSRTLSLWERPDGSVWMKCFAGCDNEEIVRELGLSFADLYPRDRYIESTKRAFGKSHAAIIRRAKPAASLVMVYAGVIANKWDQIAPVLGLDERDKHIFLGASADLREVLDD